LAVAGALLLITCLNLAGLLLARNVGRQHEFATRRAIGATRGSLVAQLLTEALVLAGAAGVVGVASAAWSQRLLESWYAYALPGLRLQLDSGSLFLLLAFIVGSAVALGLVPAWSVSRQGMGGVLHGARGDGARAGLASTRALSTLVVGQVALSLMLLMGAAVMLQTVENILAAAGGDPDGVVHYRLRPSRVGYTPDNARVYQERLLTDVGAIPGVRSVALARVGPDPGWCCPIPVRLPGDVPDGTRLMVDNNHVTPEFFDTLQIPILRGRGLRDADGPGAPRVAIVNEALAARLWPAQQALGKRLVAGENEYEVIGVAPNLIAVPAGQSPHPYVWLAYWQGDLVDARLYARVAGAGAAMVQEVRAGIVAIDPAVHIGQETTLAERTRLSMASEQVLLGVLRTCAVVAMLLTALGLYGQLSLSVGQRRREIGVRMALGASRAGVARREIHRALATVGIGLAAGLVATWGQAQLLRAYATGVAALDASLLAASCLLLLAIAAVAAFLPARRAARVDPMCALRNE